MTRIPVIALVAAAALLGQAAPGLSQTQAPAPTPAFQGQPTDPMRPENVLGENAWESDGVPLTADGQIQMDAVGDDGDILYEDGELGRIGAGELDPVDPVSRDDLAE